MATCRVKEQRGGRLVFLKRPFALALGPKRHHLGVFLDLLFARLTAGEMLLKGEKFVTFERST